MTSNLSTDVSIALLRKLHPIKRLIHVGEAGRHTLSDYAEWNPFSALFVIPEEEHHQSLSPFIESHAGWSSVHAVLAESATERDYFKASNPRESGLLAPEFLAGIWRNIKTLSRHRVLAGTLDDLLGSLPVDAPQANWVVVNSLPALSVLQGATSCLDECDVIVARAVLDQSLSTDPSSTLSALDDYLTGRGFRQVSVQEEHHPALGIAIFAHDWRGFYVDRQNVLNAERVSVAGQTEGAKKTISTLQAACDEREKASIACQQLIAGLTADLDEQTRLATQRSNELEKAVGEYGTKTRLVEECQQQLDQLTIERNRLDHELAAELQLKSDREALIAQMMSDRDEQTRLANQRSNELEKAVGEYGTKARLVEECQRQLDQLTIERNRLDHELAAELQLKSDREALIAQMTSDRDEQTRLANQRHREREQAVRDGVDKARMVEERQRQLDQLTIERNRLAQDLGAELQLKSDREALIAQMTSDRDEQTRLASQRAIELEKALGDYREKARLVEERQRQVDQLAIEQNRLAQELAAERQLKSDREALLAQVTADRDEQSRLASQRAIELEKAVGDYREKARLVEQCQQQLEQVTIEHNRLAQELAVEVQLKSDREALLAQVTADRDEQSRLTSQRAIELEKAVGDYRERARLVEQCQQQLEEVTIEQNRLAKELAAERQLKSDHEALLAQVTADRDDQTRVANERHKEWQSALLERDTHARLAHELKTQVEQLSRAGDQDARKLAEAAERIAALRLDLDKRDERVSELQSNIEELGKSRDQGFAELLDARAQMQRLSAAVEERNARVIELEGGRDDLHARQLRLDKEILKAEAQIDLIKDVILRDKAF
jgi:hypothetical protein